MTEPVKKKIVFIASSPESLINFRLHLIKEFLTRNYSVITMAPYEEGVVTKLSQIGVKFVSVPLERTGNNPLKDILLMKKLFFLLKKEKPDIVFSYTIKPVIYGTIAAKLAGIKNIYSMLTGTGYVFFNANLKNRIIGFVAKKLFRFSLRFNNKLFFQNKDNVSAFIHGKLINSRQPIAVINGSGVDVSFFSPVSLPLEVSFLMISRLLGDKGVREYAEAARIMKNRYPNVVFKLAGWIDTNPNSISERELSQWIKSCVIDYLGKLSDVRGAIANSSVFVLPSYGEGTPRTVLEAMAMGRPIITTDVPGCRNTVMDEKSGFLIPARNVEALCDAMEYFISNPADILQMGEAGRLIAVDKYDVNKVNKCMIEEMEI